MSWYTEQPFVLTSSMRLDVCLRFSSTHCCSLWAGMGLLTPGSDNKTNRDSGHKRNRLTELYRRVCISYIWVRYMCVYYNTLLT